MVNFSNVYSIPKSNINFIYTIPIDNVSDIYAVYEESAFYTPPSGDAADLTFDEVYSADSTDLYFD